MRFFATDSMPPVAEPGSLQYAKRACSARPTYTLPELCEREKLTRMLRHAPFKFQFQQEPKHGLRI
jgi:hypothetical protein